MRSAKKKKKKHRRFRVSVFKNMPPFGLYYYLVLMMMMMMMVAFGYGPLRA
jgi:hypothetical protein